MSSKPSIKYDSRSNRWEIRGKGGALKAAFGDDGNVKVIENLEVGETGDKITKLYAFVATLSAAVAVPSGAVGIGTLQSSTGSGVGCSELAIGDMVFGQPIADLTTPNVGISGFSIPTTNTLNVFLTSPAVNNVGSLIATGFNIVAFRI